MNPTLKAWPFFKAAWNGAVRAFAARPITFLVTMALFGALGAAMAGLGPMPKLLFPPEADKTGWANGATYAGMRLGVALLSGLILSPMLVAVHRVVLKDQLQGAWFACLLNYLFWILALQLVATLAISFSLLASAVGFVRGLLVLIAQVGLLILAARLALLPPAVAIGAPAKSAEDRIDASWSVMDGRFWQFVGLMLITLLPMLVLLIILSRLGLPRPPKVPPIATPPPAPPPVTKLLVIGHALLGAAQAFTMALAASASSLLYARLAPRRD